MSHYMTALAMKQHGLKPAAKIVLYWLADHHNGETGACFPSLKTLEEECEMNRTTIIRHLSSLEEAGLIERIRRTRDNGSQTSTIYNIRLQPVAEHNSPCRKTQQPPVAKRYPLNLVNINHGNEPLFGEKSPKQQTIKRSISLPDGWVPSNQNIEDAMKRGFTTEETNNEAEQFRNYHQSKGSAFKDWDAAWRTWLGNAKKFARSRPARNGGGHNALMAGFASYAAQLED